MEYGRIRNYKVNIIKVEVISGVTAAAAAAAAAAAGVLPPIGSRFLHLERGFQFQLVAGAELVGDELETGWGRAPPPPPPSAGRPRMEMIKILRNYGIGIKANGTVKEITEFIIKAGLKTSPPDERYD